MIYYLQRKFKMTGGVELSYQSVFKRIETKYIIIEEQKRKIIERMSPYMAIDSYGKTTIRNLYFDTPDYRLIRTSLEKPIYKEKLRVRSYRCVSDDDKVFVELKKKFDHVVYKRRLALSYSETMKWLMGERESDGSQISREIDYFLKFYGELAPAVFLSYDREAFYSFDESGFRVTFDSNILCRKDNLSLGADSYGLPVLDEDRYVMEIKCGGGMPLWMASALSDGKIYKTSFSKYGEVYKKYILGREIKV